MRISTSCRDLWALLYMHRGHSGFFRTERHPGLLPWRGTSTATHCNTLQHPTTPCSTLPPHRPRLLPAALRGSLLRHTPHILPRHQPCRSLLQHTHHPLPQRRRRCFLLQQTQHLLHQHRLHHSCCLLRPTHLRNLHRALLHQRLLPLHLHPHGLYRIRCLLRTMHLHSHCRAHSLRQCLLPYRLLPPQLQPRRV